MVYSFVYFEYILKGDLHLLFLGLTTAFMERCGNFYEGIFIKDFFIPSQGGTQGPLPCFTRGDFAANTGWDQGVMRFSAATGFFLAVCFSPGVLDK